MGGLCTTSYTQIPSSSEVVEGTELPEWVAAAGKLAFTRAAEIANDPYPLYDDETGTEIPRIAQRTDRETLGYNMLETGAEDYLPYMNNATQVAGTLGQGYGGMSREELLGDGFSLESAQPFMDIYQDSMDPAIREIEDQTLRAQVEARARASKGIGSFGSRLGIMEGTAAGEGAKAAGDLRAGAAREGLNFAANRYDTEREARFGADTQQRQGYETDEASRIQQMDAYQGMAPLLQSLQTQAAAGLITSGEAERQLDQQALDIAYADFLDQKNYDREQVNFALGALAGTPYNTVNRSYTTGTQMSQNPSIFGQIVGAAGAGLSAYKMYQNS
tara:strand:- start:775 stop:1770 length:996 start_codon:yes stop_codon:yes gene_type:complete